MSNTPAAIKCYMIHLAGQGDTQITFVNKDTWDWIHNEGTAPPRAVFEAVFEELYNDAFRDPGDTDDDIAAYAVEEALRHLYSQEGGSVDNDRALNSRGDYGPGDYNSNTFFSGKSAMKFVRDNNVEVIEEFSGLIY